MNSLWDTLLHTPRLAVVTPRARKRGETSYSDNKYACKHAPSALLACLISLLVTYSLVSRYLTHRYLRPYTHTHTTHAHVVNLHTLLHTPHTHALHCTRTTRTHCRTAAPRTRTTCAPHRALPAPLHTHGPTFFSSDQWTCEMMPIYKLPYVEGLFSRQSYLRRRQEGGGRPVQQPVGSPTCV